MLGLVWMPWPWTLVLWSRCRYLPGEGLLDLGFWIGLSLALFAWAAVGFGIWLSSFVFCRHRLAGFAIPLVCLAALLLVLRVGDPLAAALVRCSWDAKLDPLVESRPESRLFYLDEGWEFGFDDVGYLLREVRRSEDGRTAVLSFEGVQWSNEEEHTVEVGRINFLPSPRCDHVEAHHWRDDWWYVWLNN